MNQADEQPSNLPPGIGAPARGALAQVGIFRLDQVDALTEAELLSLHGVGPKAAGIIRQALEAEGRSFR